MKLKTMGAWLVAGSLAIGGAAIAAEKEEKPAKQVGEQAWVKNAAQGGMAEVEMGRLAAEKAQNPEVKKYGQHMVEDHTRANDELMKVAADEGVTPPSQLAPRHMAKKKELAAASGAEFDKKYMEAQVQDHQEMIALFEAGAKSNDGKLQEFARKTLSSLKKHLQMAENVQSQVK